MERNFRGLDMVMMLEIDMKDLKPGCCIVGSVANVKIVVAMGDDGKLRIFKVVEPIQLK